MSVSSPLFQRILLIEDNAGHVLLIRRALKDVVSEVIHCTAVKEAVEKLKEQEFDLIVSDINLPDSTSVRIIEELSKTAPETPIVMLTSSASLAEAVEAMQLGARDFIVKNFDEGFREVFALSLSRVAVAVEGEKEKRRLQRETEILREVIENTPDGLAVIGENGAPRYSNSSYKRFVTLIGGDAEGILEFQAEHVIGAEECNAFLQSALKDLEPGAVVSRELQVKSAGTEAFELSVSAVPPTGSSSIHNDAIVFLRDVSALKKRERFQREILSTTTHDLRGPLGAILTASELLLDMLEKGKKPHELVLRSRSAAQGMLNLINEFLSARRIEEGNFILKPKCFPLQELIDEVESSYGTIAVARGITLSFEQLPAEQQMFADKIGLSRAVGNIVGNALKFTPRGGTVQMQYREESEHCVIGVRDTGDGMNAAELRQLFERFSRLEKHRHVAGTGLGLFVVRSIAAAHGGSVRVQSQVGKGSLFELVIPKKLPVNERGELLLLDFA